ncbi:MAG: hypothetical protein Q7J79_09310 [Gemmatimonadales bacterium]|nr:hypothetical protein [Gemmatimonadales bacterium]
MPVLTRWFLKAALLYLVAALITGVLVVLPSAVQASPWVGALTPVYFHLLMVGWVTQMIFGVAYWMFPRRKTPALVGPEWPGWLAFGALNAGLVLRAVAEPVVAGPRAPVMGALLAVSAALQLAAVAVFAVGLWPRVKER